MCRTLSLCRTHSQSHLPRTGAQSSNRLSNHCSATMLNHHGSLELPECNLSLEAQVATGIAVVRRARLARNASKNCSSTVPLSRSPFLRTHALSLLFEALCSNMEVATIHSNSIYCESKGIELRGSPTRNTNKLARIHSF